MGFGRCSVIHLIPGTYSLTRSTSKKSFCQISSSRSKTFWGNVSPLAFMRQSRPGNSNRYAIPSRTSQLEIFSNSRLQDEKGRWARTGEYMHLSNRAGSILGLPDSQESKYPVDEDHSRMVKFESPTNPAYLKAVQYLKGFLQSAHGKVLMRSGM